MRKYSLRRHPHMKGYYLLREGWWRIPPSNKAKRALNEKVARSQS
jgi:hypothetical protein